MDEKVLGPNLCLGKFIHHRSDNEVKYHRSTRDKGGFVYSYI